MVSLGAAPAFNQTAMMIVQITMNKTLTYYGALSKYGESIPLASAGIINKVGMIFFAIIIGISQGMQPIISFNYGARQFERVKDTYRMALSRGFIVALCAFLMFQFFPKQLISLFGKGSADYFQFASYYFRVYMFFTFLNFVQPMSSNFFTAIGMPKKGIFLSLTRQIIFLLPLLLIFPFFLGIHGVLFSAPLADISAFLVSILLVKREMSHMGIMASS